MSLRSYAALSLLLLIVVQLEYMIVQGAHQLEYTIKTHADGSATWAIEEKGIDVKPSFDTFVYNVSSLIELAKSKTQRNMTVPTESYLMNVSVSGSYKIVRYQFCWNGFGKIEAARIKIGDVFEVESFFSHLFGDGGVCITYPGQYAVESATPQPEELSDSVQMLEWIGIRDFKTGEPKIVLVEKSLFQGLVDGIVKNALWIFSLLALALVGSVSLYYLKFTRRTLKKPVELRPSGIPGLIETEDDEEKVVDLLGAAGGRLRQSTIADRCGFSRSKTSKLLKTMEEKGRVRREKMGREKIVTLVEVGDDRC